MRNHNIILFVVEGPAGAGKSRLIRDLSDLWQPVLHPATLPRPRSYEGEEGIKLSQMKDALASIAVAYEEPNVPLVLDRWMISQWVYGTIRSGETYLSATQGSSLIRLGVQRLISEVEERFSRTYRTKQCLVSVSLNFYLMLPAAHLLKSNRRLTQKEYPFPPDQEIDLYKQAFQYLLMLGHKATLLNYGTQEAMTQLAETTRPRLQEDITKAWA